MRAAWIMPIFLFLVVPLLSGCGAELPGPVALLESVEAPSGWSPAGEVQSFTVENLYDLVDGQAEAYFAYGFEQVAVRSYENSDGTVLRVELWQLATPEDAYGLHTSHRTGSPLPVGNGGDADPGRRLAFWQDRSFVRLLALQPIPEADLLSLGETVAALLPDGGEPPLLASKLPSAGLVDHSEVFFHEEISVQDYVWLGGENLLALGPGTDGILASYQLGEDLADLLLIQYPNEQAASSALEALRAYKPESLVAAQTSDSRLAVVFGTADERQAEQLLSDALENK